VAVVAARRRGRVLSEYIQFAAAMVLMVAILIGSYWFVIYSPAGRSMSGQKDDERPNARRVPGRENDRRSGGTSGS
jgi:ABC-type branched-subunit amino acid transport system permease subunit